MEQSGISRKQNGISKIEWLSALCMYVLFYIVYDNTWQVAIMIGIIIVTLVAHAGSHGWKLSFRLDGLLLYMIAFCVFCYLSTLWAQNRSYAIGRGNKALEILAAIFVLYLIFRGKNNNIRSLLKLIQWGSYIILAYAVISYGWNTFIDILREGTRISNDYLNANTLGMCAAYAVVINMYFALYEKFKIWDLLMVLALLVLIVSGSRKAVIILIAGILAVIILKNYNRANQRAFVNSFLRIIFIVAIAVFMLYIFSQLPIFNGITNRLSTMFSVLFEGDTSEGSSWLRMQYNQLGWQLFGQNPIIGIGMDNARIYTLNLFGHDHYLHNNYMELLACGGLIGTILYYSIYAYIIYIMIKYVYKRDSEWNICMILLLIQLVMDFGMVSYSVRGTYVFLLLFWLETQKLKQKGNYLAHTKCQSDLNTQKEIIASDKGSG